MFCQPGGGQQMCSQLCVFAKWYICARLASDRYIHTYLPIRVPIRVGMYLPVTEGSQLVDRSAISTLYVTCLIGRGEKNESQIFICHVIHFCILVFFDISPTGCSAHLQVKSCTVHSSSDTYTMRVAYRKTTLRSRHE